MQMNRHQSLKKPSVFIGDGFKLIASMFGFVLLCFSILILGRRNRGVHSRTIPGSRAERAGLRICFISLGIHFYPDVVIFVTSRGIIVNIKRTIQANIKTWPLVVTHGLECVVLLQIQKIPRSEETVSLKSLKCD